MLQQYKRQIDEKKWSRKSTQENPARERKETFPRVRARFFLVGHRCRVRLRLHTSSRSIFVCNCTRFIIVSWTCSIIKIVSTLETELLALKLLQVEAGSRIVLPAHATPYSVPFHMVLHWNYKRMSAPHYACFSLGEYSNGGCCCIPCSPIHSSAISGLAMMMPMTRYVRCILKAFLTSAE